MKNLQKTNSFKIYSSALGQQEVKTLVYLAKISLKNDFMIQLHSVLGFSEY